MKKYAISILSAGLDSILATHLAMKHYTISLAITFNYGQRAFTKEASHAEKFCIEHNIQHQIIHLPWLEQITQSSIVNTDRSIPTTTIQSIDNNAQERANLVWVPNRNGIFVSIAAAYAESNCAESIVAGFNAEEAATFSDNSQQFLDKTNDQLIFATRHKITLISPTIEFTKKEIASHFISEHIPFDSFWSCYQNFDLMCGKCESCIRSMRAFQAIGVWEKISHRYRSQ